MKYLTPFNLLYHKTQIVQLWHI